jgi:hypothetical protein
MDIRTVHRRVEHEGVSFLTITLPAFGKDFERSLELGQVERHLFSSSTSWKKREGGLPLFLGGFLAQIFDAKSCKLLNNPNVDAILAVRQLTLMFGKILLPCSDARIRRAMDGYIECELDISHCDSSRPDYLNREYSATAQTLFARAFTKVDHQVYYNEVLPKHGPGKTADNLSGNRKYEQTTWTARLEEIFPAGEFLLPNWSYLDHLEEVDIREPGQEEPVKVVPVPKTLKTPRIIAMEPTCMQYMQQAVLPEILEALKDDEILRAMLGFDDQKPNQFMAQRGSLCRDLATLDLSEASDRVSNQLVNLMFKNHRHLHAAIQASRSTHADVPGHGVIPLTKFASMGSALTFPVEAMVFLTIILNAISRVHSSQVTQELLQELKGRVRIYGDDIIIPVDYVRPVIAELEAFGLKVNVNKSFWNGPFRESCGKEYFDGYDVSVVKVRRILPSSRGHVAEIISAVSLRNQLFEAGFERPVEMLDRLIRKLIHHFPVVEPNSSVLGRYSYTRGYETRLWDVRLHKPVVKGYVVHSTIPADKLDGRGALLKFFLKRSGLPSADEKHLERGGRPHAVKIKLRWASPV